MELGELVALGWVLVGLALLVRVADRTWRWRAMRRAGLLMPVAKVSLRAPTTLNVHQVGDWVLVPMREPAPYEDGEPR